MKININRILVAIGIVVILLLTFWLGMMVGYRRAAFSYGLGDNYYRALGPGARHAYPLIFDHDDLPSAHGAVGKIIKISLPTFVVANSDNVEKIVRLNDDTLIRQARGEIASSSLAVGNYVIVLGSPDAQAEIAARFIRVLPPPFTASTTKN